MSEDQRLSSDPAIEFAHAIGELILWTNLIDQQINEVCIIIFALPDHPLMRPIVAQLDIRPKLELLKTRGKLFSSGANVRGPLLDWIAMVEKVNNHRNIVAHHHIAYDENDELYLSSVQLSKIMKALDPNFVRKPDKRYNDLVNWLGHAFESHTQGVELLKSLQELRQILIEQGVTSYTISVE